MEPPVRSSSQLEPGNTLLRSYFTPMSVVASQEVLFSLDMDMIKKKYSNWREPDPVGETQAESNTLWRVNQERSLETSNSGCPGVNSVRSYPSHH